MKQISAIIGLVILLAACTSQKSIPDVSGIAINLKTERFEQSFFSMDTLRLTASLQQLQQNHPGFTQDFLFNILGTSPDSSERDTRLFLRSYRSMYQASQEKIKDFSAIEKQIKRGLQFVRYYFPQYKTPERLITFIGPLNSYGNIITPNALAVGLQVYMGRDYPLYLSGQGQQLYPLFVSRRFEPAYIPVNCMKNIIDDMYPNASAGQPLVEQMIESGKRQYLLDQLLPELADTLKTGYTAEQLKGCYASEKNIWSLFLQNDLLYSTDPNMARDFLNDGPNTQLLGEASPGNIGQFVGTQIVAKWMEKNKKLSLDALMKTPAGKIFTEAKYKPK
jgi:hypothetical protein